MMMTSYSNPSPVKRLGGLLTGFWGSHKPKPTTFWLSPYVTEEELLENLKEFVEYWYEWDTEFFFVPRMESPEFPAFVGHCIGIMSGITPEHLAGEYVPLQRIAMTTCSTAFYNPDTQFIGLPNWLIDPEKFESFGEGKQFVATAVANGFAIHEYLHVCYSDPNILLYLQDVLLQIDKDIFQDYGVLVRDVFNILEDLRIERFAKWTQESFLDASKLVLLPRKKNSLAGGFDEIKVMWDMEQNAITGTYLSTGYKRGDLRTEIQKMLPEDALDCLVNARIASTNTKDVCEEVVSFLRCWDPLTDEQHEYLNKTRGLSDLSGSQKLGLDVVDGSVKDGDRKHVRCNNPEFNRHAKKSLDKARRVIDWRTFGKVTRDIPKPIIQDIMDIKAGRLYNHFDSSCASGETERDRVMQLAHDHAKDKLGLSPGQNILDEVNCQEDYKWIRMLNSIRARNRTYGKPVKRGPELVSTRLARLMTDGEVFAFPEREEEKTYRVEIVILLDGSGSTYDTYTREYKSIDGLVSSGDGKVDLFTAQIVIAHRIADALKQAQINHVVLTHTSTGPMDMDTPMITKIASRGMKAADTRNDKARFEKTFGLSPGNNYDGIAIKIAAGYFTDRKCRKVMIVTSDGQPYGEGYGGSEAIEHTREAINRLRDKEGIDVYYLSLTKHVVEANDKLAGKKYNLHAYDDLEGQFKKLVTELSKVR